MKRFLSRARRLVIATGEPAVAALRDSRRALSVIAILGALAVGALVPVSSFRNADALGGTSLSLPAVPNADGALGWTESARPPTLTQAVAIQGMYELLLVLAWVVLGLAAVSMLAIGAARARGRGADIAIRRAVGASRRRVLLSLLIEAGMTSTPIFALGLGLAIVIARAAIAGWPGPAAGGAFDARSAVIVIAAVVTLGAILPLRFARRRRLALGDDAEVRLAVPALQLGLSVAVLMSGWLLTRRAEEIAARATTAGGGNGLVIPIDSGDTDPGVRAHRYAELLERLEQSRDFDSVSLTAAGEILGLGTVDVMHTDCGRCVVGTIVLRWHSFEAAHHFVSPDTFAASKTPVVEGRAFTPQDDWGAARVAVVNRLLAINHFEGGNAVGRVLYLNRGFLREPYTVVGVVDEPRSESIGGMLQPAHAVYLSVLQHPPARTELLLRPGGSAAPLGSPELIREALGPSASISSPVSERSFAQSERLALRWFGRWFTLLGGLALVVAAAGAAATIALWVRSRTLELGVRRAVGGSRVSVGGLVVRQTLGMAAAGLGLGLFFYWSVVAEAVRAVVNEVPLWETRLVVGIGGALVTLALFSALAASWPLLRAPPARSLG